MSWRGLLDGRASRPGHLRRRRVRPAHRRARVAVPAEPRRRRIVRARAELVRDAPPRGRVRARARGRPREGRRMLARRPRRARGGARARHLHRRGDRERRTPPRGRPRGVLVEKTASGLGARAFTVRVGPRGRSSTMIRLRREAPRGHARRRHALPRPLDRRTAVRARRHGVRGDVRGRAHEGAPRASRRHRGTAVTARARALALAPLRCVRVRRMYGGAPALEAAQPISTASAPTAAVHDPAPTIDGDVTAGQAGGVTVVVKTVPGAAFLRRRPGSGCAGRRAQLDGRGRRHREARALGRRERRSGVARQDRPRAQARRARRHDHGRRRERRLRAPPEGPRGRMGRCVSAARRRAAQARARCRRGGARAVGDARRVATRGRGSGRPHVVAAQGSARRGAPVREPRRWRDRSRPCARSGPIASRRTSRRSA